MSHRSVHYPRQAYERFLGTAHTEPLVARNTLLAGTQEIHRLKPQVHRDVAVLENSPDFHGELFAALVALVEANTGRLTMDLADAVKPAAMRANRPIRTPWSPCCHPQSAPRFNFRSSRSRSRADPHKAQCARSSATFFGLNGGRCHPLGRYFDLRSPGDLGAVLITLPWERFRA
jgi:hypothetical protein